MLAGWPCQTEVRAFEDAVIYSSPIVLKLSFSAWRWACSGQRNNPVSVWPDTREVSDLWELRPELLCSRHFFGVMRLDHWYGVQNCTLLSVY
jgi:hypothetical protein